MSLLNCVFSGLLIFTATACGGSGSSASSPDLTKSSAQFEIYYNEDKDLWNDWSTYYYFTPDGLLYMGDLPRGGIENFSCSHPHYKSKCKSYRISGNRLEVDGQKPVSYFRVGSNLKINNKTYWLLRPVKKQNLIGRFVSKWSAPGVIHESHWEFFANGRYKTNSFGGSEFGSGPSSESAGQYEISGYTLRLKSDEGKHKQLTLVHKYDGATDQFNIDEQDCRPKK